MAEANPNPSGFAADRIRQTGHGSLGWTSARHTGQTRLPIASIGPVSFLTFRVLQPDPFQSGIKNTLQSKNLILMSFNELQLVRPSMTTRLRHNKAVLGNSHRPVSRSGGEPRLVHAGESAHPARRGSFVRSRYEVRPDNPGAKLQWQARRTSPTGDRSVLSTSCCFLSSDCQLTSIFIHSQPKS